MPSGVGVQIPSSAPSSGDVAKWQGRGLQNLHRRFESGRRLQAFKETALHQESRFLLAGYPSSGLLGEGEGHRDTVHCAAEGEGAQDDVPGQRTSCAELLRAGHGMPLDAFDRRSAEVVGDVRLRSECRQTHWDASVL